MGRNRHHAAGAVVSDDEVRRIERDLRPIRGIDHEGAGEHTLLLGGVAGAVVGADRADFAGEGIDRSAVAGRDDRGQRGVLGRDRDEGHAEQRVGPGGEHGQLHVGVAVDREVDLGAVAFANPIALLSEHRVGPAALESLGAVEQLLGVGGGPHVPGRQLFLDHWRAGAPALAVDHLLVGEYAVEASRPIYHGRLAIDQPLLDKVEKEVLLALGVARIGTGELARPRIAEAHALELTAHVGDVLVGPSLGMGVALDRRLLGGQPERIPAHGMEDREAAHALVARDRVPDRVVAHMAHVQLARRVREHLQHVIAPLAGQVVTDFVRAGGLPGLLPGRLDGGGIVDGEVSHGGTFRGEA